MSAIPLSRVGRLVRFLERWLDRWLAGVPGREHHDAWAAEAMRLGL